MSKLIPPPPPQVPVVKVNGQPGYMTPDWARFITAALMERVGGYNAPTIPELQAEIDDLDERVTVLEGIVFGLAAWAEVEIDLGAKPVFATSFVIEDARITEDTLVRVLPSARAATGRTADDWLWDSASFAAEPGDGRATVYANFLPGPVVGLRKVQYSIG